MKNRQIAARGDMRQKYPIVFFSSRQAYDLTLNILKRRFVVRKISWQLFFNIDNNLNILKRRFVVRKISCQLFFNIDNNH